MVGKWLGRIRLLLRGNRFYELSFYFEWGRFLFCFRDFMVLFLGLFDLFLCSLCFEFGNKGFIDYERVIFENFSSMREELIDYLKKDVFFFGGVM